MVNRRAAERILLTLSLIIAFWLRVHQLEQLPAGLHFDEAANAILSSEIAFEGYRPVFIASYTGKETLFFYAAGSVMNRVGSSIFSLRLTAAFFGMATLAAVYRLGIAVFRDRRVALISVILLGANFSHLLFSRLGFRAISQPLTQALAVLCLVYAFQGAESQTHAKWRKWYLFGLAGLFLGLTAHTYLAARLFPIALALPLLIFLAVMFRKRPESAKVTLLNLCVTGGIAAVVLAPLLAYFVQNPDAFWVRIGQVGSTAESITTLEGLRRTVLMLFWRGDPYIRFNIPFRPLFFPLWAIPAAVGVWRLTVQQSAAGGRLFGRLAILIIPAVMLLPTALATSEIVPSNLRAIGIFPFIVFWPAVGLVWLLDRLFAKTFDSHPLTTHSLRRLHLATCILLLGLMSINLFQSYFTDWGSRQTAFYETEGDVRQMADYLNRLDTDRPTLVSTRFVPHPSLAFLVGNYDRLPLIPDGRTVVYPQGEMPLMLFPASSPENGLTARFDGEREAFRSADGVPTFTTLAIDQPFPQPQTAVSGNFGFAVELLGYDLKPGAVGETLTLRTYHHVLGNPGFNIVPFVHLEDELGNRWSQLEQPGYPPGRWQAGDQFVQQFELPLPAGLPPTGGYTLRVGWFDGESGEEVARFSTADGTFAGSALLIENVSVRHNPSAQMVGPPHQMLNKAVADGLILAGLDFGRTRYFQGDRLDFALWWSAAGPPPAAALVTQLAQNGTVVELEAADPAAGRYPFADWETPAFVIDRHQMQIPADLPPGDWALQTLFVEEDGESRPLFDPILLTIEPLDLMFAPPPVQHTADAVFGGEIRLVGHTLDEAAGTLELVWQGVSQPAGDYVAFVQGLNADGSCCVWQADRPLSSSAARPTSRWLDGEFMVDRYEIDAGSLADSSLIVGVYRPENGIRLTVDGVGIDFVELSGSEK